MGVNYNLYINCLNNRRCNTRYDIIKTVNYYIIHTNKTLYLYRLSLFIYKQVLTIIFLILRSDSIIIYICLIYIYT